MEKLNAVGGQGRFQGLALEIAKVVYMFSIVSDILVIVLASYTKDLSLAPLALALLLVPVYSVVIRRLVKNFFLFFLAHVLLFGLMFLCPGVVPMVVIGVYVLVDVVYIYVRKFSGENDPMTAAQLIVAFAAALILYFASAQLEIAFVQPIIITIFILQIIIFIVYFHQMNMRDTLRANNAAASQSVKKIHRLNNKIIFLFVGILLVLIGAGVVFRFDLLFTMIGRGLLSGLRAVARLLFRGGGSDSEEISLVEEVAQGGSTASAVPDDYQTWTIWLVLEKILMAAGLIAAVILIAYIAYRLYQKFKMDRVEEDELSDYQETTLFVERVKKEKQERRSLIEWLNQPNDQKVRRIYRKKIRRRIKAGDPIQNTQTPQEICKAVKAEDLSTLTAVYEKARYSNMEITREDVQRVS